LAVNAAVASLVSRGALAVGKDGKFRFTNLPTGRLSDLEQRVYESVGRRDAASLRDIRTGAASTVAALHEQLAEPGLLVAAGDVALALLVPLVIGLAVPVIGLLRLANGLAAGRPVGFLVVALVVTALVSLIAFARRPFRSRRGDAVLDQLRFEHARLKGNIREGVASDVALDVALFGVGALVGSKFDLLRKTLAPPAGSGDGGWSSGCSSGGGCGGGGCGGGGGGGGGGCGGCGGG
jgi:uncharacterized protein (TIGR04222 family)